VLVAAPALAATKRIQVGPSGLLVFADEETGTGTTTITAGYTVEWVWASSGHSTRSARSAPGEKSASLPAFVQTRQRTNARRIATQPVIERKGTSMTSGRLIATGALVACLLCRTAGAADHADGPRASADPSADITDVFAWVSPNAARLNLVMDLVRNATPASRFSDSVQYVFHTTSRARFGATPSDEVDIVCTFNPAQKIRCQAGGELVVAGDASGVNGIASANGKLRVFAGLRDDPFFFNLAGFRATARTVAGAASSLTFDAAGCPALDAATSAALVSQLRSAPGGGPPVDNFARFNVLAIVLSLDKSVVTKGGPIVTVWGSTNRHAGCADGEEEDCNEEGGSGERGAGPPIGTVQIDRMGRAGVNTALTNPFFRESVPTENATHEAVQDAYNAATDPAQWGNLFSSEIAANLAIFDSLDGVCGNQLLAGPSPVAGRYNTLAAVLADDQLYVNTASGTCTQYLAVEANAVGIANDDCGGRTPLENTIDTTYSLLAAGTLSGVTNGIFADADGTASLTAFPFLDRPN
jgi:hypothetical protein